MSDQSTARAVICDQGLPDGLKTKPRPRRVEDKCVGHLHSSWLVCLGSVMDMGPCSFPDLVCPTRRISPLTPEVTCPAHSRFTPCALLLSSQRTNFGMRVADCSALNTFLLASGCAVTLPSKANVPVKKKKKKESTFICWQMTSRPSRQLSPERVTLWPLTASHCAHPLLNVSDHAPQALCGHSPELEEMAAH